MINDQESFLKFLQEERDKIQSLNFNMNKDFTEKQIMNITQRREYFQHITILSIGLAGVTFFIDRIAHVIFFVLGFSFLIVTVVLIITWLREVLDKEGNELQAWQDKYNSIIDERDSLIDEFAIKKYESDIIKKYYERVRSLSGYGLLKKDAADQAELRKNRGKQTMNYFNELILFLFYTGILFLFLSIIPYKISWYLLMFILLLIFSLSFQDFVVKKGTSFSKFISYFHREIFHKVK